MSDPIGAAGRRIARVGQDIASGERIDFLKGVGAQHPSFGDALAKAVGEISGVQDTAADYAAKFLRGEQVELHQVMASAEEAAIALEMLVEVRNKFVEAYRTVINMQS